jgi:polyhydroxyalkanoate synthase
MPVDPFGITQSFMKAGTYWMTNAHQYSSLMAQFVSDLQDVSSEEIIPLLTEMGSMNGSNGKDHEAVFLDLVRKYSKVSQKVHAAYCSLLKNYIGKAEGMSEKEKANSTFWTTQAINSISPNNYFWTNPSAVQKYIKTKGKSLRLGFENLLQDLDQGDMVQIADMGAFDVGKNLALSPGYVVYRNQLMEVIQYSPTTETTYETPVVFIQPWVNKFYIMDLAEDKSFVKYLVDQGFTVFITSWKNPSPEMRDLRFEDYMIKGALKAIDVARGICKTDQVHAAGYCIGGTVLTALMAWLNRAESQEGPFPIKDFTIFASLADYGNPGELGVYITEKSIEALEEATEKTGYLDKKYVSMAFRMLRSNDLIWRYYAHNYLQGETPPKSDYLYWNSDSTRLTTAMASFCLRELYLKNSLIKEDAIVLANRPINLRKITQPLFVVGAEQDHICPWQQTFRITGLVKGPVRYTLASEGHITGIINPPSTRSKRKYCTGEVTGATTPEQWLQNQSEQQGSWWTDWAGWLSEGCSRREPPTMGNEEYNTLEKAPGSYVRVS